MKNCYQHIPHSNHPNLEPLPKPKSPILSYDTIYALLVCKANEIIIMFKGIPPIQCFWSREASCANRYYPEDSIPINGIHHAKENTAKASKKYPGDKKIHISAEYLHA